MTSLFRTGIDALALLYAILFFPVPIFWLAIHSAIHFWRRFGNQSFWIAAPVWVMSGTIMVLLRHRVFAERLERNAFTWILGSGLVLLGIWINRHVHREFSLRRLAGLPEISPGRYPGGAVRSGIYARVRHPRYLEFIFSFLGLALLTGALGIFLLAIMTVLLYLIVAPLEERELREQYGVEYEAYAQAVPRFVPRLRRTLKPQISP
jgi:protein-S-isoprenylcysteine O-methyltransferase Ste14